MLVVLVFSGRVGLVEVTVVGGFDLCWGEIAGLAVEALRRATSERSQRIHQALDVLAGADLDDRADAWR